MADSLPEKQVTLLDVFAPQKDSFVPMLYKIKPTEYQPNF